MPNSIGSVTRAHLCFEIHVGGLQLVVMAVGEPAETILDLSVPWCGIFPGYLFNIFDRVKGEVDVQVAALALRLT